jgi:hypothetical protein
MTHSAQPGAIADASAILLELGQSGGPNPHDVRPVESLLSRQLKARGFDTAAWSDLAAFDVAILHPGRTLIEKLLRGSSGVRRSARRARGLDGAPPTAFRVGGQLICGLGAFIGPGVGMSRGGRTTTDGSLQTSCPAGSEPKGIAMPWFPDFISAAELARRQTRAAGQADPVAQYITALNKGDIHAMESVWPGEVVVYDPRAGEIPATSSCTGLSARFNPGWPDATPGSRPWPPQVPAGGRW